MQLDLEGGVEGEVAVVVAAAPLGAVATVVHVHVQRDRLLLRDGGSWSTGRGRDGGVEGRHRTTGGREADDDAQAERERAVGLSQMKSDERRLLSGYMGGCYAS